LRCATVTRGNLSISGPTSYLVAFTATTEWLGLDLIQVQLCACAEWRAAACQPSYCTRCRKRLSLYWLSSLACNHSLHTRATSSGPAFHNACIIAVLLFCAVKLYRYDNCVL
jgi:hypothetical protein